MESLYFLIPFFLVIILSFPLMLRLRVILDLNEHKGIISLYLFKLKLVLVLFEYIDEKIIE